MARPRPSHHPDPGALFAGAGDVAVAMLPIEATLPPLFEAERRLMPSMVSSRRREFAWGRAAARTALARLGVDPVPLLPDADRVPVWPAGTQGSISHSGSLCAAAVARGTRTIGFDLETARAVDPDLWPALFTAAEIRSFADTPRRAVVHFSAKEAVFKAHFPRHRQMFDFHHLEIELQETGAFRAVFTRHRGLAFVPVTGRWQQTPDVTACGVVLARPPQVLRSPPRDLHPAPGPHPGRPAPMGA
ncbi:4'-phosphopantetheinyl transferase superfamily protein [Salipiger sp. IMCC34102]|uniref:4'-phosphopantetheinyl transferase family protein n=1 Tax=Salipiger sp. IMCC34102 TaxID=2510647 RepID=UPI00101BB5D5|nr:4'-phosphopantetheinyl transferase superfamily protein [Salipiger sp. IMCC34102]RYH01251.1 4'-phosphopantetheinyl transferase superfamily protein [Salipiger sp. IMCC34102]